MSCCGKKRQSLQFFPAVNQVIREEEKPAENSFPEKATATEVIFRYTGTGSLEVKNFLGSNKYLFSASQPELTVLPEDAAMMRAFAELVEVKREKVIAR